MTAYAIDIADLRTREDYASLEEALYWLAADIPPIHLDDKILLKSRIKRIPKDSLEEAKDLLLHAISRGTIEVWGQPCSIHEENELGPRVSIIDKHHCRIPTQICRPASISIKKSEVKANWPDSCYCKVIIRPEGFSALIAIRQSIKTAKSSKPLTGSNHFKGQCRIVARTLWHIYPDMTAEQVVNHYAMQEFAEGKRFKGKNTIKDWIRDLDPRPSDSKRGPKTKKNNSRVGS